MQPLLLKTGFLHYEHPQPLYGKTEQTARRCLDYILKQDSNAQPSSNSRENQPVTCSHQFRKLNHIYSIQPQWSDNWLNTASIIFLPTPKQPEKAKYSPLMNMPCLQLASLQLPHVSSLQSGNTWKTSPLFLDSFTLFCLPLSLC